VLQLSSSVSWLEREGRRESAPLGEWTAAKSYLARQLGEGNTPPSTNWLGCHLLGAFRLTRIALHITSRTSPTSVLVSVTRHPSVACIITLVRNHVYSRITLTWEFVSARTVPNVTSIFIYSFMSQPRLLLILGFRGLLHVLQTGPESSEGRVLPVTPHLPS